MQKTLKYLKPSSLSKAFSGSSRVLLGVLSLSILSDCSSPRLHSDLKDTTDVLVRKWTLQTHGPFEMGDHGTEYSNPVVIDNTLLFGNRSVGLVSLYPGLNQTRWVLPIKNGVMSEIAHDRTSAYFGGGDGFLYSVELETGKVNWRYNVRNPIISRPTVEGGRVLITTSDDTVYAFDIAGKWLWHYRRRSSQLATILGASAPLISGNQVFAGLSDGFLVCLSLEEGQLKWERKLHNGIRFTDVNAHPVLDHDRIYVPSYDGSLYSLRQDTGEVYWKFDSGGGRDIVVDGETIYLPSSDGAVYALQKSNAKVIWKFQLDSGVPTKIVSTDKYLIFGSSFQYLYAVDKTNGEGVYRFNAGSGSGFSGAPALDPITQRVYILSGSGNLYNFALRQPPRKIHPHGVTDPYSSKSL